jgi:hypothetical protein
VLVFSDGAAFAMTWIGACALVPLLVFAVPARHTAASS